MNKNERIIIEFSKAWSRLDAHELSNFFHEDGMYHNIPITPVIGRKKIKAFIKNFTFTWEKTNWEILYIASVGNIVITERLERTISINGKTFELPCAGFFEMENKKIKIWRDYFDLGTYFKYLNSFFEKGFFVPFLKMEN
jgi:limonene-1,2-epoxide hydrolase